VSRPQVQGLVRVVVDMGMGNELRVQGVLMHRWAERDGTYADLVAQRSQSLAMLPGRSPA
jgi:hypothetical protein